MLSVLRAGISALLGPGIVIAVFLLPFSLPACGASKSKHKSRSQPSTRGAPAKRPKTMPQKSSGRLTETQRTKTESKPSTDGNDKAKIKLENTQSYRSKSNKSKEKEPKSDPAKPPRVEKKVNKQKESKGEESSEQNQKKDEKTDLADKKTSTNLSTNAEASNGKDDKKAAAPEKEEKPVVEKKSPPPIVNEDLVKKEFLENSARRKRQEKEIEEMGSAHEMDDEKSEALDANKQLIFKENECRMYYTNAKSVDWMDKVAKGLPVEKKQLKKKVVLKEEEEEDDNNNNII